MGMALVGFMYHKVIQERHMRVTVQRRDSAKKTYLTEIISFKRIKRKIWFLTV